ncbi:MAG: hypothetical protein IKO51_07290 [Clostridia bacterium]|nr:hypothetical protein [Clostridia bacterium]
MVNKIFRKNIGKIILAVIACLPMLLVSLCKTAIVQQSGVHTLKTLQILSYIIAAAFALFAVVSIIVAAVREAREVREQNMTQEKLEELKEAKARAEKKEQAKLNVRGPLKDTVIYERFKSWLNEDWGRMTATRIPAMMSDILRQMNEMNGYQSKLSRLLTNNGADYLEDTNQVLESVEQCILRKVRKVLNCFVVYETNRQEDVQKIEDLLVETRDANEAQLNNVKEFLFAITDFLNKQGEDDTGIEKLNIYKKTILESTNDPE